MRRFITASAVALAVASAGAAHAQLPVELELRGGAAFPTADMGATELQTGGGAGFNVNLRFMPHVAAYAGWDFFRLTPKNEVGADYAFEHNGYAFGFQFQHPAFRNVGYWARAGGLYAHVEVEDDGEDVGDSGHEFGWEAGGGVSIPVSARIAFTPGVRYRTMSFDVPNGGANVDLSYLAAEIGLQFSFGARPAAAALRR